jgi:hypothetical protein
LTDVECVALGAENEAVVAAAQASLDELHTSALHDAIQNLSRRITSRISNGF